MYELLDCDGELRFADEIVNLDGLKGLDWVLAHANPDVLQAESWQLSGWLEDALEVDGEEAVEAWKQRARETNEFVRRELDRQENRVYNPREREKLTYAEMRGTWTRRSTFSWVVDADDDEIKLAWKAMESESDPDWLWRLAGGLKRRPDLCEVEAIIRRGRDWPQEPNPFAIALELVSDPRVRQFGLDLLAKGQIVSGVTALMSSIAPGDEPTVLEAIGKLEDEWDLHSVGLDILQVKVDLDWAGLLNWVYEWTPCSFCRNSAVHDLIKHQLATREMLEECLLDCDQDTREVAETALKELGTGPS